MCRLLAFRAHHAHPPRPLVLLRSPERASQGRNSCPRMHPRERSRCFCIRGLLCQTQGDVGSPSHDECFLSPSHRLRPRLPGPEAGQDGHACRPAGTHRWSGQRTSFALCLVGYYFAEPSHGPKGAWYPECSPTSVLMPEPRSVPRAAFLASLLSSPETLSRSRSQISHSARYPPSHRAGQQALSHPPLVRA